MKRNFFLLAAGVTLLLSLPTAFIADKNGAVLLIFPAISLLLLATMLFSDNHLGKILRDWSPEVFLVIGFLVWISQLGVSLEFLTPVTAGVYISLGFAFRHYEKAIYADSVKED